MTKPVEKDLFSLDFLNRNPDLLKVNEIKIDVDEKLGQALTDYESIKKQIGEIKIETVLENCKEMVIANLCTKFAVNSLIAGSDKDGGSVTTLHNAKKQVFANEQDKAQFNRAYDSYTYHGRNRGYRDRKTELEGLSSQGTLYDDYTGKNISGRNFVVDKNGNTYKQNRFDVEHFNSAKRIHDNDEVRFAMTEEQSANLANNPKNLGATAAPINRSKGDKDFDEWKDTERADFDNKKNSELYGIDCELADKKIKESKEFIKKEVFKAEVKKYSKELATTSLSVGGKTFLYSAIGQISLEFIKAAFGALIEAFKNRHTKNLSEILDIFKSRISEAVAQIKSNWKEILANSFEGALMNFLNNLLVFAINMFATTLKNVVSLIRTGFTTLCSAIKLITNPPKDMTEDERNDAICKILVFGMSELTAFALSESIENLVLTLGVPKNISDPLIYPFTAFMGGIIAAVILGVMQKVKNDGKKSKLHVTLIAQNNVILQAQIIQNWCILAQGNYLLKERAEQFDETITSKRRSMNDREKKIESGLDEIDSILNQLNRI